jgi:molybdate transport system substrate-binding protein
MRVRLPRRAAAAGAVLAMVAVAACSTGGEGPGGPGRGAEQATVRVAAAADLKFALDEVVDLVETEHPGIAVAPVYGSSGTFLQQIENGAPFDLYLSADLGYPRALVESGMAAEDDLFPYAVGRLVLWVPDGSPVDPEDGLRILTDPRVRRVSIANPEHAPYGEAAVAAMRAEGVYDEVRPRLVLGENVAQAAEFVQSGNADAGIVALSLALADPVRDEGRWQELPLELYPRLDQGGVVLAGARDVDAARTVRDALLGQAGVEILARYGFSLPGE